MDEIAPPPVLVAGPPALDTHVLAVERRDDPLDLGFLLCDGLLAPLPAKVRLPHEEEEELDPA
jgi:hypothetical protein